MSTTTRKAVIGLTVTALALAACSGPPTDTSLTAGQTVSYAASTPEEIRAALVPIVTTFTGDATALYSDGTQQAYPASPITLFSTGFFVNEKGDIATAGHAVDIEYGADLLNRQSDQYPYYMRNAQLDGPAETETASSGYDDDAGYNEPQQPYLTGYGPITNVDMTVVAYPQNVRNGVIFQRTPLVMKDVVPFDQGDAALLAWPYPDQPTPFIQLAAAPPQIHDPITVVGFSEAQIRQSALNGYGGSAPLEILLETADISPTFNDATVAGRPRNSFGVVTTQTDASIDEGMSGGPLMANNRAAGINSYGINATSPLSTSDVYSYDPYMPTTTPTGGNHASDLQVLIDLLARNNVVQPTPATDDPTATSDQNVNVEPAVNTTPLSDSNQETDWMWLWLLLFALLLVAILVAVITLPGRIAQAIQLVLNRELYSVSNQLRQYGDRVQQHTHNHHYPAASQEPVVETHRDVTDIRPDDRPAGQ